MAARSGSTGQWGLNMAETRYYIILDCPPGDPRPGDLIGDVVKGMGLDVPETSYKFMGEWRYDFPIPKDQWEKCKSEIMRRIRSLYHQGMIRYGAIGMDVKKEVP